MTTKTIVRRRKSQARQFARLAGTAGTDEMIQLARQARAAVGGRIRRSREGHSDKRAFGYDAAEDSTRRRPTIPLTSSEEKILPSAKRKRLIGTARDVIRNYCTAAWMIRCHLDYVSRFSFQARTGDSKLDDLLEARIAEASLRKNFDVAGRWNLAKAMRVSEARRVLDGDILWAKLAGGAIQLIEGDRVRTPTGGLPIGTGYKPEDFVEGIACNTWGRMDAACVCKRNSDGTGYSFERIIPVKNFWLHAYWDTTYRVDQVRGITPLAPALNTLKDIYEGIDLAMAKAKVAQMFGLVIYREKLEEHAGWGTSQTGTPTEEAEEGEEGGEGTAKDTERYEVDPGAGPFKLELEGQDRAGFLTTNTPESELLAAMQFTTDISLKALDIPYSFYDSSKTNYYGQKADITKYENSAKAKREDNQQLMDEWVAWRVRLMVLNGSMMLPAGRTVDDLDWEWIPAGMPWTDKLRDIKGDTLAISYNLDSEVRAARRSGQDAYEIAEERMAFEKWINEQRATLGLPPLPRPSSSKAPGVTDKEGKSDENA
jgi:capsid protein